MRNLLLLATVVISVTTNVRADEQLGRPLKECKNINGVLNMHHVPHETDPHKFYKCLGSDGLLMECPIVEGERMIFSPEDQRCELKKNGSPMADKPDCTKDTRNKPHESNCHHYYKCVNGVAEERVCMDGHNFNPIIAVCDIIKC